MKPYFFIYGSYSLPIENENTTRNIEFQTVVLTPLPELERFQQYQDNQITKGYFDIIAHSVEIEPSTIRESLQLKMAYYTGATVSGYGFLNFDELVNEISGDPINTHSDRTLISLGVPLDFAKMEEEPESFLMNIFFYNKTDLR